MMEVYTPERIKYHAMHTGNNGSYNGRAHLTESDVIDIRTRYKNGEPIKEIYKDYQNKLTYGSFCNTAFGYN